MHPTRHEASPRQVRPLPIYPGGRSTSGRPIDDAVGAIDHIDPIGVHAWSDELDWGSHPSIELDRSAVVVREPRREPQHIPEECKVEICSREVSECQIAPLEGCELKVGGCKDRVGDVRKAHVGATKARAGGVQCDDVRVA